MADGEAWVGSMKECVRATYSPAGVEPWVRPDVRQACELAATCLQYRVAKGVVSLRFHFAYGVGMNRVGVAAAFFFNDREIALAIPLDRESCWLGSLTFRVVDRSRDDEWYVRVSSMRLADVLADVLKVNVRQNGISLDVI